MTSKKKVKEKITVKSTGNTNENDNHSHLYYGYRELTAILTKVPHLGQEFPVNLL